jgi:hypothetical protein
VKSVFLKMLPICFLVGLLFALYVFFYAHQAGAQVFRLFPETCMGGFDFPERAAGVYQVATLDTDFITQTSSATVLDGRSTQITCTAFKGAILPNTTPKKVSIHIAWKYGYDAHMLHLQGAEQGIVVTASGTTVSLEENAPSVIIHDTDAVVSQESDEYNSSESESPGDSAEASSHNDTVTEVTQGGGVVGAPEGGMSVSDAIVEVISGESVQQDSLLTGGSSSDISVSPRIDVVPVEESPNQPPAEEAGSPETQQVAQPEASDSEQQTNPDTPPVSFLDWFFRRAYAEELHEETSSSTDVITPLEVQSVPVPDVHNGEGASSTTEDIEQITDTKEPSSLEEASTTPLVAQNEPVELLTTPSSSGAIEDEETVRKVNRSSPIEVLYSFGGDVWESAGFADEKDYSLHAFTFSLSSSTTWEDLSSIHVAVRTHAEIDNAPLLLLIDGMWLDVVYEGTVDDPHPIPSEYRGDYILGTITSENMSAVLVERPVQFGTSTASSTELWLKESVASSTSWKYIAGDDRVASTTKIFFREKHILWIGHDRVYGYLTR